MKRKSVGYFDGVDPVVLTSLICDGYDTIPISNGVDNYGQHVRLFNEENKVTVLIGYLHKICAPEGADTQAEDVFHICHIYQMPFLIIVPRDLHKGARKLFASLPEVVRFVDPADLLETTRQLLKN
jgi:hypothetical protein